MLDPKEFDYTIEAHKNVEKCPTTVMIEVKLYTMIGDLVAQVKVLPFMARMPEVITWGSRCFILRKDGDYYEGMNFVVLPEDLTENL